VPKSRHLLRGRHSYQNRKFDGVYLARKDGDELLYAGKVERGFSEQQVRELKERLCMEATIWISHKSFW
jgi:ATP-dependent DNA ligase